MKKVLLLTASGRNKLWSRRRRHGKRMTDNHMSSAVYCIHLDFYSPPLLRLIHAGVNSAIV